MLVIRATIWNWTFLLLFRSSLFGFCSSGAGAKHAFGKVQIYAICWHANNLQRVPRWRGVRIWICVCSTAHAIEIFSFILFAARTEGDLRRMTEKMLISIVESSLLSVRHAFLSHKNVSNLAAWKMISYKQRYDALFSSNWNLKCRIWRSCRPMRQRQQKMETRQSNMVGDDNDLTKSDLVCRIEVDEIASRLALRSEQMWNVNVAYKRPRAAKPNALQKWR